MNQAIDEGRAAIQGIHTASTAPSSLEHAFSNLLGEVATGRGLRLRVFVQGKPWTLNPAIQEQLFLIGREAAMNALRHSQATKIQVEVEYLRDLLRVFVRDNGRGINPEAVQKESAIRTGVFAECVSAQKTSTRDLLFGAGQVQGQKCASPFRSTSRSDNPWMGRPRIRDQSRLAREQREQQQLESVGSNEKQSVDEGSAATPKKWR